MFVGLLKLSKKDSPSVSHLIAHLASVQPAFRFGEHLVLMKPNPLICVHFAFICFRILENRKKMPNEQTNKQKKTVKFHRPAIFMSGVNAHLYLQSVKMITVIT